MKLDEIEWASIVLCGLLAFLVALFSDPRAAQAVHDAYVYQPATPAPYVAF